MDIPVRRLPLSPTRCDIASAGPRFDELPGLALMQYWRASPEPGLTPGSVKIGWQPDALWVFAQLQGDDFFNTATENNSPTHESGDVFELFLADAASERYLELHVTPDNIHLQLDWPDVTTVNRARNGAAPLTDYLIHTAVFSSDVATKPGLWTVLAHIPARALKHQQWVAGQQLRAAFCRYDAFRDGRPPVCSSTAPLTAFDFHRPAEWHALRLA